MPRHVAKVKMLDGGICKCLECGEIMLEDERHWHEDEQTIWEKDGDPSFLTKEDLVRLDGSYARDRERWTEGYIDRSAPNLRKRVIAESNGHHKS